MKYLFIIILNLGVVFNYAAPPFISSRLIQPVRATVAASSGYVEKYNLGIPTNNATGLSDGTVWAIAESFTAASSFTLHRVKMLISKTGSPTASLNCAVYSDVAGTITAELAVSTTTIVNGSGVPTTPAGDYITFDFNGLAITSGTRYWVIVYASAAGGANKYVVYWKTTGTEIVRRSTTTITSPTWSALDSSAEGGMIGYE